ncbi:MAG TPA: protocatechuate 3,4-dioxygenase subunit alpha [Bauldia sp.]|nr:protocatechuate 3,4-dioxygenase subunit alpha [Bauldia sp.]
MAERGITPSQTVGPFFAYALTPVDYDLAPLVGDDLVTDDAVGAPIVIEGVITDGAGAPIPDAMIEIWQADGEGRYAGTPGALPNARFRGFGRSETAKAGRFRFVTVKPGRVPGPAGRMQAPHIDVGVFARGMLKRLVTRIYFADEADNAADPILELVPPERRATLVARPDGDEAGRPRYVFDIRVQGDGETVFFAV